MSPITYIIRQCSKPRWQWKIAKYNKNKKQAKTNQTKPTLFEWGVYKQMRTKQVKTRPTVLEWEAGEVSHAFKCLTETCMQPASLVSQKLEYIKPFSFNWIGIYDEHRSQAKIHHTQNFCANSLLLFWRHLSTCQSAPTSQDVLKVLLGIFWWTSKL